MDTQMVRRMDTDERRRGFTLLELLVVLAIIGILASIVLVVAARVTEGGRVDQTKNIIKTLDQVLVVYTADKGTNRFPLAYVDDLANPTQYPIVDGRLDSLGFDRAKGGTPDLPEPTTQLFLAACGESQSLLSAVNAIQGTFKDKLVVSPAAPALPLDRGTLVQTTTVRSPSNYGLATEFVRRRTAAGSEPIMAPIVRDPWGNHIRYVHPRYAGGYGEYFTQNPSSGVWDPNSRDTLRVTVKREGNPIDLNFRRSMRPFNPTTPPAGAIQAVGDADEGIATGSRPYFYSPGPDNDPGTRGDNVYTEQPTFPEETRKAD